MTRYEYRVMPAPARAVKVRGAKTTEARFAHALMEVMNALGAEGWEYLRTDTLPCEERVGLTGRTTRFQNMLVFRRTLHDPAADADRPAEHRSEPPLELPAFRHAAPARPQAAAPVPQAAPAGPRIVPVRPTVAARLAASLTARPKLGPALSAAPGATPRVGAAPGNGVSRPDGGVAAE